MAATSNHKYDVYKWIEKVIDSCVTYQQLVVADRLIRLHYSMYEDDYLRSSLNAHHDLACDHLIKNMEKEYDTGSY